MVNTYFWVVLKTNSKQIELGPYLTMPQARSMLEHASVMLKGHEESVREYNAAIVEKTLSQSEWLLVATHYEQKVADMHFEVRGHSVNIRVQTP